MMSHNSKTRNIPVNTGKKQAGRSELGRFTAGYSGNPYGRPQGSRNQATLFSEVLRTLVGEPVDGDGRTYAEVMVKRIIDLFGNPRIPGIMDK
jgi:hypothetical protein